MNGINTPNNIVFNPGEGDYKPVRQDIREISRSVENADAALRADYTAEINKALELEENAAKVVEIAQIAANLNEIDTAENIRTAAENILKFGI